MQIKKLQDLLLKNFSFDPTTQQQQLIAQLSSYVMASAERGLFLLKGYAGTGKTTLVSALVKSLWPVGKKVVLLAPTGRAAKVLSSYSGKKHLQYTKKFIG